MTSQQFLFVNVVVAILIAALFVFTRKGSRAPSQLNFKAKNPSKAPTSNPQMNPEMGRYEFVNGEPRTRKSHNDRHTMKELNVIFNYNGHSWDAYEVLGIPAGSSLEVVQRAYVNSMQSSQKDSVEFLTAAFQAITKKTL